MGWMMEPGNLDKRIQLLAPGVTQDAAGQPVDSWTVVATVWAQILHLNGVEQIKSSAENSVVQTSVRIRYRPDVTGAMRLQNGAAVYKINAVLVHDKERIDLVCEVLNVKS